MIIAFIKKLVPVSVKKKLKEVLLTPESQALVTHPAGPKVKTGKSESPGDPARKQKGTAVRPLEKGRPCVSSWPHSVCECDMHLGAFKRARIRAKLLGVLKDAGIEVVDDAGGRSDHLAINVVELPRVLELLRGRGFIHEAKTRPTKKNEYDFPAARGGQSRVDLVPNEYTEIYVQPLSFCDERRADALSMAVLITTFNDVEGVRYFHSERAISRTQCSDDLPIAPGVGEARDDDPIDIVITTVDGSDPEWRKRFDKYVTNGGAESSLAKSANAARYTSHDELRFVLRSIYYYAPYVRKIHIVTDRQCPRWLDIDNEMINLVDHADIIDSTYLPTFNSDAIESCLWKIPGLSERFVYFNDDIVLMAPTTETTFFTTNGVPRFYASPRRIPSIPADVVDSYTMHAHLMSSEALEKRGYSRPTVKFKHVPFAGRRQTFVEMEEVFADELNQTRSSRIRSERSFATISFLYPNYSLATRSGVLSQISYQYIDISWSDWKERLLNVCRRTDVTVACINESHDASPDNSIEAELSDILASRFPAVPPWELHEQASGEAEI